jgi:hypothetical protein
MFIELTDDDRNPMLLNVNKIVAVYVVEDDDGKPCVEITTEDEDFYHPMESISEINSRIKQALKGF